MLLLLLLLLPLHRKVPVLFRPQRERRGRVERVGVLQWSQLLQHVARRRYSGGCPHSHVTRRLQLVPVGVHRIGGLGRNSIEFKKFPLPTKR